MHLGERQARNLVCIITAALAFFGFVISTKWVIGLNKETLTPRAMRLQRKIHTQTTEWSFFDIPSLGNLRVASFTCCSRSWSEVLNFFKGPWIACIDVDLLSVYGTLTILTLFWNEHLFIVFCLAPLPLLGISLLVFHEHQNSHFVIGMGRHQTCMCKPQCLPEGITSVQRRTTRACATPALTGEPC